MAKSHCSNVPQFRTKEDQDWDAFVVEQFRRVAANEVSPEQAQTEMTAARQAFVSQFNRRA